MKKIFTLLSVVLLLAAAVQAQTPDDVLRYSPFQPINSSARSMATGGAMGSLGGDMGSTLVNPAGLGFYRTNEFIISPGWNMNGFKSTYRGTDEQRYRNSFSLGPIGFVGGFSNPFNPTTSNSIAITVTQTANFNNIISYRGLNNYSSAGEQYAEEVSKSNSSLGEILSDPRYAYGSALAVNTYLVDTFRVGSNLVVKALPESVIDGGKSLLQSNRIETKGGITQINIALATNKKDKWYLGATIGVPIINYERRTTYTESDPSGTSPNFNYYTFYDTLKTKGLGLNAILGAIYRPVEHFRVGLAIHTPSLMSLTDTHDAYMITDTKGYQKVHKETSNTFTNGFPGKTSYTAVTPWRILLSGSYVFNEVTDVTKQKAFITADIEYVGYAGANFQTSGDFASGDVNYYNNLNTIVNNYYKGAFNFRLGGELKFNTIMARAGFAYYGNPYRDAALKANKTLLSAGLGYRNHGFFIDLAYVYAIQKDVNFPYRLEDKANTFANIKTNGLGNVMFTAGVVF